MAEEKKYELDEAELADVTAGAESTDEESPYREILDGWGRICGYKLDGVLYYWPCKVCPKPTHRLGSGFTCSRCRAYFDRVNPRRWGSTEERLQARSYANW